jgi:hypothetical protein
VQKIISEEGSEQKNEFKTVGHGHFGGGSGRLCCVHRKQKGRKAEEKDKKQGIKGAAFDK